MDAFARAARDDSAPGTSPSGLAAVRLELRKLRHKHLPLIAIAILAAHVI